MAVMKRFLTVSILVVFLVACADRGLVLGLPADELERHIIERDFAFLEELEDPEVGRRAYRDLDAGAAYYIARALIDEEYFDIAAAVLEHEATHGEEPWRRNAAVLLVRELAEHQRYEELAETAVELVSRYPDEPSLYHGYAEALYRLGRDHELEDLLSEIEQRDDAVGAAFTGGAGEIAAEAALWRAVLAHRVEDADRIARFDALYREFPPNEVHSRVYLYVISRPELYDELGAGRRALYEGKHHLVEGRFSNAWSAFSRALDEGASKLLSRQLVHDIGRAGELGGGRRDSAARLEEVTDAVPDELGATLHERIGRLYRAGGAQSRAIEHLRVAHERDPENERVVWYLLSASSRTNTERFLGDLRAFAPMIRSPGYFDDLFEQVGSRLVAAGEWFALWDVYRLLQEHGTERMQARYAFILAVATSEHGFVPESEGGRDAEVVRQELFAVAANQNASPYYAMVARAALGRELELYAPDRDGVAGARAGAGADSAAVPSTSEAAAVSDRRVSYEPSSYEIERLVAGYFRYGLLEQGYREALRNSGLMSSAALVAASETLRAEGKNIEALRLLGRARGRRDFELDREHAELLYPVPYREEFDAVVEEQNLDWALFYALVREESHFAAEITSHAGAIGLSQLMPATAADISARMGLDTPSLTDPETNLMIGAFYLRGLLDRFPSTMHALAAYNGGQGRVRSWQRMRPDHGDFLFHEAIPFYETREYVRKIVVSAVYYAGLYQGRSAPEVIASVFPQFNGIR